MFCCANKDDGNSPVKKSKVYTETIFVAPNNNEGGDHQVEVKTQEVPVEQAQQIPQPLDQGVETTQSASVEELLSNLKD